ncbi:MAG: glycosyltransferase family 4 protein [Terriglobales bacterium]
MHVLVTADTLSGVWPYTRELVTGLAERGVQVTLVSMGEIPTAEQVDWMDGLAGLDFRPTAFRVEWMRDAEDDLDAARQMLEGIIAETKPDLLHLNQFCFGRLRTDVPKVMVAHGDVLSWWQCVHHAEPQRDHEWVAWYRDMVSQGLRDATAVVAPSQWMLSALRTLYTRPALASVIYHGRTPSLFNPHMSKELIALSVGRIWDFGKNSALLSKFESPLPVYLAGPDSEPENPVNRTIFTPRQRLHVKTVQSEKELRLLYARSAIYITTSQYEPFGMSPVEAALSRCAIVASDIPTHREIWGEAACYFRNNDASSLEDTLRGLSSDRELSATYGKLAYDHARKRFTAARMVDDYLHLYHALARTEVVAA